MPDRKLFPLGAVLAGAAMLSLGAQAAPFTEIRIGDEDGFGYGTGASSCVGGSTCQAANGGDANVGTGGVLGAEGGTDGDFLPDLNENGVTATGQGDDFDNRSGETVTANGATDTGTVGALFTDISLSTSYEESAAAEEVYDANTDTFGTGGAFPDAGGDSTPNQPGFEFRFTVDYADIDPAQSIFFNVIFGDYDVLPFNLELTFNDGSGGAGDVETRSITQQNNAAGEDGLIQAAFAELEFGNIFSDPGTGAYTGFLDVKFDAPAEPYTAYDFVELSTEPITTNVPAPGTLLLLGLGMAGLGWSVRARARC